MLYFLNTLFPVRYLTMGLCTMGLALSLAKRSSTLGLELHKLSKITTG